MKIDTLYKEWLKFDSRTKEELELLSKEEIRDRFYKEIEFGTGGIRGEIGAGTNRVNYYTVYKITMGVISFLNRNYNSPSVVIAYDSRNFSLEFSYFIAHIIKKNNIKVKIFEKCTPTPILSYAVRKLKMDLGIVITASHNPKEYNGYKIYGSDGGQITDCLAKEISNEIKKCDYNINLSFVQKEMLLEDFDYIEEGLIEDYISDIYNLSYNKEIIKENGDRLKIIYTPLHGTGGIFARKSLQRLGFNNIKFVESQIEPNGNFPTVKVPNPEEKEAFKEAMKESGDIIVATDPDCDRVGIMIKNNNKEFVALTGNQIGTLLTYYVLTQLRNKNKLSKNHKVVKTIVTTDIVKEICKDFKVDVEEVLTGFKYIGEKIKEYETDENKEFLLGFEESYGYLLGNFVRDKDGVIATSIICEMTLYYKCLGINLIEVLEMIYERYGHFEEKLLSFTFKGVEGREKIEKIMKNVVNDNNMEYLGFAKFDILDYNYMENNSMRANMVKITFPEGKVIVRPSGTEPKIKFYLSAIGNSHNESEKNIGFLKNAVNKILDICEK